MKLNREQKLLPKIKTNIISNSFIQAPIVIGELPLERKKLKTCGRNESCKMLRCVFSPLEHRLKVNRKTEKTAYKIAASNCHLAAPVRISSSLYIVLELITAARLIQSRTEEVHFGDVHFIHFYCFIFPNRLLKRTVGTRVFFRSA